MTRGSSRVDGSESSGSSRVNRRGFLASSAAAVAGLAGCMGGGETTPTAGSEPTESEASTPTGTVQNQKPFEGETLTAAVWSGGEHWMNAWNEEIVPQFEEETGATVELATVWAEILSKIQAAPEDDPPWDVTVGDAYVGYNGVQAELFEKINYDNVPNFEDVYPFLKEFREHEYGVPVSGMPMAILYRTDQNFQPTTWAEFGTQTGIEANTSMEGTWHAYASHIAAIAMDDLPKAGELYDEQYHEAVFNTLNDWNIDSWYSGGAQFWEELRNGVVDASQYYMNTHRDADGDDAIGFQYPNEGSIWYWDHYRVVRGTDKQELAEAWIDFLLDPEIQSLSADLQYNAAANAQVSYEKSILQESYPTENSQWEEKATFFELPYLPNHWSTFSEYFKQVKTGSWSGGG